MQVTLEIPDTLATELTAAGKDPSREALELLAVDAYRNRRLYEEEVRLMLGYESRFQVHALLKEHDVPLDYTAEDFDHDIETLHSLFPAQPPATK